MSPMCGYSSPTTTDGPCERPVAREGLRCHHHPRTTVDVSDLADAPVPDAEIVVGEWPLAEAHAVVGGPVREATD